MLKISAVYLIGKTEIPIHYTIWADVEQALLIWSYLMDNYFTKIIVLLHCLLKFSRRACSFIREFRVGLWHGDEILQVMLKLEIHPFFSNRYYLPVKPLPFPLSKCWHLDLYILDINTSSNKYHLQYFIQVSTYLRQIWFT